MIPQYEILRMEHGLLIKGTGVPVPDMTAIMKMGEELGYNVCDAAISTALGAIMVMTDDEGSQKWRAEIDADTKKKYGGSIDAWLNGTDTGSSSKLMALVLSGKSTRGIEAYNKKAHPYDPADIGRCFRMLDEFPELKKHFYRMREISPVWDRLIDHWAEMEALYKEEVPNHTGKAPKLYKLMEELIYGKKE